MSLVKDSPSKALGRGKFSPEINGLRAVAVIAVIIFHLDESWLPLGYIGVDIFFVLSGFLITKIILREIDLGKFKLSNFITRRIKRIFPALFAVLFVSSLVAILVFSSADHRSYFRSLRYAAAQGSNFFFAENSGYFDVSNQFKALLHTWSLGVEEQFYLFWPILLMLITKLRCPRVLFFGLTIASSFAIMIHLQKEEDFSAFYMIYARAWQFAMGGILTSLLLKKISRKSCEILAFISLACLVGPSLFYSAVEGQEVLMSIIICLGVCGIIYASQHHATMVGRVLSLKPMLFIGAISYSLYLWHWPVIVFYNYIQNISLTSKGILEEASLGVMDLTLILGLCFALAILSYRRIENRFRYIECSHKKVFIFAFVCIGSFAGFAKFQQEESKSAWRVSAFSEGMNLGDLEIELSRTFENEEEHEDILLIGDSHAEHFSPMIEAWAQGHGLKLKTLHRGGTPPLILAKDDHPFLSSREVYFQERVMKYLENNPHVEHVILAACHGSYLENPSYEEGLEQAIAYLLGQKKRVCLIAQVPPLESSFLKYLELTHLMNHFFPRSISVEELLTYDQDFVDEKLQPMRSIIERLESKFPALYVWHPEDHIHTGTYEGIPCYSDDNHLNIQGARYLTPYFDYPLEAE
ncbi:MAG: acyltransferase family protein [Akkermansiaceae bacterium]|nr:acyltransferase family protein [Akkermansiaceae bacterium]